MNDIPLVAWIIIILVLVLTIIVNIGLVALMLNRRMSKELINRLRRPNRTANSVKRFQEVLRDPFRDEREQLNELSDLVSSLDRPTVPQEANEEPLRGEEHANENGKAR